MPFHQTHTRSSVHAPAVPCARLSARPLACQLAGQPTQSPLGCKSVYPSVSQFVRRPVRSPARIPFRSHVARLPVSPSGAHILTRPHCHLPARQPARSARTHAMIYDTRAILSADFGPGVSVRGGFSQFCQQERD